MERRDRQLNHDGTGCHCRIGVTALETVAVNRCSKVVTCLRVPLSAKSDWKGPESGYKRDQTHQGWSRTTEISNRVAKSKRNTPRNHSDFLRHSFFGVLELAWTNSKER